MTPSSWRLDMARTLAQQYTHLNTVSTVFASGSVARQTADRLSDCEMCVIWTTPPTEAERAEAITGAGGDIHLLYPFDRQDALWEDTFFLGRDAGNTPKSGCQFEVSHFLIETIEAKLDQLLIQADTTLALQSLACAIRDGIGSPMTPLLSDWKRRVQPYPHALQLALIEQYGIIDHFWSWQKYLERGANRIELAALFARVLQQVVILLGALNRQYWDGYKWIDTWTARFPLAPRDFVQRTRQVFDLPIPDAAHEIAQLVEETFTLIEAQQLGVPVERFREVFRWRRPAWDAPPPMWKASHL